MRNVKEIESAVSQLSVEELSDFREWFDKFDAELWDKQFEADVNSGKLDELTKKAISDFQNGKCKPL